MSLTGMRNDIRELKQIAALEKKRTKEDWVKNMTDEELQEELDKELTKMGFNSSEEFYDAAKKFILEKDSEANVTHEVAICNRIFELMKTSRYLKSL